MLDHSDLDLIAALAVHGGPRRAAVALGAHPATVYRRLKAVEQAAGAPLFERVDGRYQPSDLAREIIAAADENRTRLAELNRRLSGADVRMSGTLAATTTDSLAPLVFEAIERFRRAHPQVQVRLSVSNDFADMARHEAEVAIRPTRTPPETLVGRRAGAFDYGVYARPGAPDAWIALDDSLAAIPAARWLAARAGEADIALRVNSMWAAAEAAAAGLGRAVLPSYLVEGRPLERVQGPISEIASQVWVLTHEDLRRTPRIRAFVGVAADHLAARLA